MPGTAPYRIAITPVPTAKMNECVANVADAVTAWGGTPTNGWALWEPLPDVILEAEFHVLWTDADGELRDVTPQAMPFLKHVHFLPDPTLRYEGRQIPNYRVALVDDSLVYQLIDAQDALFEAVNRGELATRTEVPLTAEIRAIQQRIDQLSDLVIRKHYFGRTV